MRKKEEETQAEREARLLVEEGFVIDVLERICECMETQRVSRAELARRVGTTPQNVTKILRGQNITLRTLAKLVHALGGVPDFRVVRRVSEEGEAVDVQRHLRLVPGGIITEWRHPMCMGSVNNGYEWGRAANGPPRNPATASSSGVAG